MNTIDLLLEKGLNEALSNTPEVLETNLSNLVAKINYCEKSGIPVVDTTY